MFENWFPRDMTTLRKLLWFRTAWEKSGKPPVPTDPLNTFVGSIVRFFSHRVLPLVKLSANFTPIQDLNGYDNPWPAGGGVNKFNQITEQARLDPDGSVVSAARLLTDYIPVVAGETYAVHIPYFGRGRGAFYDSDKNLLSYFGDFPVANTPAVFPRDGAILQTTDGYYFTFIAPSGASYVRYNIVTNYGTTYNNDISFNYPSSVTTYAPYSNECPITGHTGCDVVRTGKNLLNDSIKNYSNKNIVFGGPTSHVSGTSCSLKAGTYTFSVVTADGTGTNLYVKDSDTGANISGFPAYSLLSKTFTLSKDTNLLVFCYKAEYTSASDITHAQIELGSTATDYEAFQGTTVPISFGQTVYGGKLTVFEDGSGQVVADRAMLTNLASVSGWFDSGSNFALDLTESGMATVVVNELSAICSKYKTMPSKGSESAYNSDDFLIYGYSGQKWIMFRDSQYSTLDALKASLGDTQLVIYLATPITIPLTASQINTLVGENVVWVNDATGDITVQAYGTAIT